jgi:hypothetical protein
MRIAAYRGLPENIIIGISRQNYMVAGATSLGKKVQPGLQRATFFSISPNPLETIAESQQLFPPPPVIEE